MGQMLAFQSRQNVTIWRLASGRSRLIPPAMQLLPTTLIACAAALLAVPVAAQDAAGEDDTIIVMGQGEPVTIRAVQRQARDIAVRQGDWRDVPLARFEDRLCPGVTGLTPEVAALIIDRVRANARMLDVRVQDDGCAPNFVIVFTPDGEALLRRLMEENPMNFQYLNQGQKDDILEPGPVHVWTSVEPRTLTGMPIAQARDLTRPPVMGVHAAHTRIYTTTRRDITSVMIAFDNEAVRDLSVGQLADYATMRGLAQTRPAGGLSIDSILSLFEEGADAPPQRLTNFDTAYLRALYADLPNLPAAMKLGNVGEELRELTRVGSEAAE